MKDDAAEPGADEYKVAADTKTDRAENEANNE
jgi:hypothetical protein